jgi:hypothetical protein
MAQANEGNIGVGADVMGDYDAICQVLQLCTEGEAKGDVGKLGEAFHADARMFGAIAGTRYDVPIEELFELAESEPADTGTYRSRILSVHQTGDGAVALVAEEGYWESLSFIDYFQLARIDGDWKIVRKLFIHTGGEPPEGI